MPEIRLIATKHLVFAQDFGWVFDRTGMYMKKNILMPGKNLGCVLSGPDLPIDDLDIIQEWRDLQEYAASTAGK